jgi:hypothetical protein
MVNAAQEDVMYSVADGFSSSVKVSLPGAAET